MALPDLALLIERARVIPMPDLVKTSGLPRQTIVDLLTGTTANPSIKTVTALSEAVDVLRPESAVVQEGTGHG